jgi:hypothetical protein
MRIKITAKVGVDLTKLDIGMINQIGLVNATQALVALARENAPYETGTLKKGIGAEPGAITRNTTQARVGPRKIIYAVRREFENKKNPSKKFYMKRTGDQAGRIVQEEFTKAVRLVSLKLSK